MPASVETAPRRETRPLPKTVLTFLGQGSQRVGMGLDLIKSPIARQVYEEADKILGFSISELSFNGPDKMLGQTRFSQPAILVNSFCRLKLLEAAGQLKDQPIVITAGHSLGEYTALVAAGSLTFKNALLVIKKRGELMQMAGDKNKGALVILAGQTEKDTVKLHEFGLSEALFNAPDQITFGGPDLAIAAASQYFGRRLKRLPVSCAPHTKLMEPAVEPLARVLDQIDFQDASIPIIPNSATEPVKKATDIKRRLLEQLTQPVLWMQTLKFLDDNGIHRSINVSDKDTTAQWHYKTVGGVIVGTFLTIGGLAVGAYEWRKHRHQ